jgi:exosortase/archaeosortase family protein
VANLIFAASILPLALFINGLRIALIGVVGNAWGPEAGAQFHDYSGYITLILCFFILFKGARLLGWKD